MICSIPAIANAPFGADCRFQTNKITHPIKRPLVDNLFTSLLWIPAVQVVAELQLGAVVELVTARAYSLQGSRSKYVHLRYFQATLVWLLEGQLIPFDVLHSEIKMWAAFWRHGPRETNC